MQEENHMESRLSRRTFVTGLGAPLILGAADKAGAKAPVLGTGAYRFEAIHDWGTLPPSISYGNTHGVCEDSQGRIYIHHTVNKSSESADSMVVFDAKGKFIKSWGKEFKGGAHGLHIRKEGNNEFLYLCDTARALVVKTDLDGREVWTVGYPSEAEPYAKEKLKYSPTNVAIGPDGTVYVADGYGSSYINMYDTNGKYKGTFGGKGKEPGQMDCPHGLAIDSRGKDPILIVADRANNRLQRFNLEGKHINFVNGVNMPCHFHFNRAGVMVVPDLAARVTLMDRDNQVITHLGEDDSNTWKDLRKQPREQFKPGKFICPHSAAFDHNGNIFVVEWVEVGRVTKLRKV